MKWLAKQPTCVIVTATKQLIDDLLTRNHKNRPVRDKHVQFLRRAIQRDEWVVTNSGVGIDIEGNVIDAQHRLLALKEEGYPSVPLLLVYGLPTQARAAIDIGARRTMLDFLHLHFSHPESSNQMVATTRAWGIFSQGLHLDYKPSPSEVAEWYEMLMPVFEMVFAVPLIKKIPGGSPVIAAVCQRLITVKNNQQPPLDFLEGVCTGVGLEKNSPPLALRNWLAAHKAANGAAQKEKYDRTATALLAFLEGRKLSKLYRRHDASALMQRA